MDLPFHRGVLLQIYPDQVPDSGQDGIVSAVYVPGFRCARCGKYMESGFIFAHPYSMLGVCCAKNYGEPDPWLGIMKEAKYYTSWKQYKKEIELNPLIKTMYRALSLYAQIFPEDKDMNAMFKLMADGTVLSPDQEQSVRACLNRGLPLDELLKVRNRIFRLGSFDRIQKLNLQPRVRPCYSHLAQEINPVDWKALESLSKQVQWGLSYKQIRMFHAIEDKYMGLLDALTSMIPEAFEIANSII